MSSRSVIWKTWAVRIIASWGHRGSFDAFGKLVVYQRCFEWSVGDENGNISCGFGHFGLWGVGLDGLSDLEEDGEPNVTTISRESLND
jgi:hypothetical protein